MQQLAAKTEAIRSYITPEAQSAYYQLVLYPTKASAGLAQMYLNAEINRLYAKQGRLTANAYAEITRRLSGSRS